MLIMNLSICNSSNTATSAAATGTGCGVDTINYVLGITKAYATRVVGLSNRINKETGELLGKEEMNLNGYKQKKRCGWFDEFSLDRQLNLNKRYSINEIDVLDEFPEIKNV